MVLYMHNHAGLGTFSVHIPMPRKYNMGLHHIIIKVIRISSLDTHVRNTEDAVWLWGSQYSPRLLYLYWSRPIGPRSVWIYDGQVVYCGLSTASEVFLIFTTQLHQFPCIIMQWFWYLDKREVLQQEYSKPPIHPSPHFRWVANGTIHAQSCWFGYFHIKVIRTNIRNTEEAVWGSQYSPRL